MAEQHRKSIFRKYYMITENSMPVLTELACGHPAACKLLLYFFHRMDRTNLILGATQKIIRDAYTFEIRDEKGILKPRSLTSATITNAVKYLQSVQIIDVDYSRYRAEKGSEASDFLKSLTPVVTHAYVVNPDLVWATYQAERAYCRFPAENPVFAGLQKGTNDSSNYYMFNKNYEEDFYWMAQRCMKCIAVFYYLVCRMDARNEVSPERGGTCDPRSDN